jgi:hypothetical protein
MTQSDMRCSALRFLLTVNLKLRLDYRGGDLPENIEGRLGNGVYLGEEREGPLTCRGQCAHCSSG